MFQKKKPTKILTHQNWLVAHWLVLSHSLKNTVLYQSFLTRPWLWHQRRQTMQFTKFSFLKGQVNHLFYSLFYKFVFYLPCIQKVHPFSCQWSSPFPHLSSCLTSYPSMIFNMNTLILVTADSYMPVFSKFNRYIQGSSEKSKQSGRQVNTGYGSASGGLLGREGLFLPPIGKGFPMTEWSSHDQL